MYDTNLEYKQIYTGSKFDTPTRWTVATDGNYAVYSEHGEDYASLNTNIPSNPISCDNGGNNTYFSTYRAIDDIHTREPHNGYGDFRDFRSDDNCWKCLKPTLPSTLPWKNQYNYANNLSRSNYVEPMIIKQANQTNWRNKQNWKMKNNNVCSSWTKSMKGHYNNDWTNYGPSNNFGWDNVNTNMKTANIRLTSNPVATYDFLEIN